MNIEATTFAIGGFVVSLVLTVLGIYIAIRFIDSLTGDLDEWDEIRKGNVAVSVYLAGAVISLGLIIMPSVIGLYTEVSRLTSRTVVYLPVASSIAHLVFAYVVSVIVQYVGISTFSRMTKRVNEWAELKRGNVAVGLIMASTLIILGLIMAEVMKHFMKIFVL